jgi:hypothetical protein
MSAGNPHLPSGSPAKVRITEAGAALEADKFEHPIDESDLVDQHHLPDQCNDNQADNEWHEK